MSSMYVDTSCILQPPCRKIVFTFECTDTQAWNTGCNSQRLNLLSYHKEFPNWLMSFWDFYLGNFVSDTTVWLFNSYTYHARPAACSLSLTQMAVPSSTLMAGTSAYRWGHQPLDVWTWKAFIIYRSWLGLVDQAQRMQSCPTEPLMYYTVLIWKG